MVVEHFRAQLIFPGAAAVGRPLEPGITNLSGSNKVHKLGQRPSQDGLVARAVMRRAEGPANGMIDENGARRPDSAHDVHSGADDYRGDALAFNDMSDETDGLVAKGSVGYEQREVHMLLRQFTRDGRCQFVFYLLMPPQLAHERKVAKRKPADDSLLD